MSLRKGQRNADSRLKLQLGLKLLLLLLSGDHRLHKAAHQLQICRARTMGATAIVR